MNIHQVIADLKIAIDGIRTAHPELADDPEFACEVFSAETDLENILARLVDYSNDAKAMACAVKARRGELGLRQDRFELKAERLRALILNLMERAGLPKVELTEATLSIRHIPPAPIVADEDALPGQFFRIKRTPNLEMIKEVIATGNSIPGIVMSNGHTSLTVRTK